MYSRKTLSTALAMVAWSVATGWGQQTVPGNPAQAVVQQRMQQGVQPGVTPNQSGAQQQAGSIPVVTPGAAVQQGMARVPQQPFPALSPQEQQYLDQVLDVWEKRTANIKRYECKFTHWEYDPTQHPTAPSAIGEGGTLKFMEPDKGLFKVDKIRRVASKASQPEYKADPRRTYGDYWICDGNWVHILDRNEKKANRIELPPAMRGKQIYQSPLPFLFGVKAAEIKQRYWIRTVKPPAGDDSVWLEAWPKRADDAGNYSRVQVVLDRKDIMPRALIVFLPNWRPDQQHREIYEFTDRHEADGLWDAVKEKLFLQEFIQTKLPSDWNVIEEPYMPPQEAVVPGQGSPNSTQPRVAQPPTGGRSAIR